MEHPSDTVLAPGIVANPKRRRGRPRVAGTRMTVDEILDRLAGDWSIDEILRAWPHLTREHVLQAIAYAAQLVREDAPAGAGTHDDDGH